MAVKGYFVENYERGRWEKTWWGMHDLDMEFEHFRLKSPNPVSKRQASAGLKEAQKLYPDSKYRIVGAQ